MSTPRPTADVEASWSSARLRCYSEPPQVAEEIALRYGDLENVTKRKHFHDAPPAGNEMSPHFLAMCMDLVDIDSHFGRRPCPEYISSVAPWDSACYDDAIGSTRDATRRRFFDEWWKAQRYAALIGRPHLRKCFEEAAPAKMNLLALQQVLEKEQGWQRTGSWKRTVPPQKLPSTIDLATKIRKALEMPMEDDSPSRSVSCDVLRTVSGDSSKPRSASGDIVRSVSNDAIRGLSGRICAPLESLEEDKEELLDALSTTARSSLAGSDNSETPERMVSESETRGALAGMQEKKRDFADDQSTVVGSSPSGSSFGSCTELSECSGVWRRSDIDIRQFERSLGKKVRNSMPETPRKGGNLALQRVLCSVLSAEDGDKLEEDVDVHKMVWKIVSTRMSQDRILRKPSLQDEHFLSPAAPTTPTANAGSGTPSAGSQPRGRAMQRIQADQLRRGWK